MPWSHLVAVNEPVGQRYPVCQELVDDAAMVQAVLRWVTLQIGRQQPPGFICGTARQYFPSAALPAAATARSATVCPGGPVLLPRFNARPCVLAKRVVLC